MESLAHHRPPTNSHDREVPCRGDVDRLREPMQRVTDRLLKLCGVDGGDVLQFQRKKRSA